MKLFKRLVAAAAALSLLAGCSELSSAWRKQETFASEAAPTLPPAPQPISQTLVVPNTRTLQNIFQRYAASNHVTLSQPDATGQTDLHFLDIYPADGRDGDQALLDLTQDPLLYAAAARAGSAMDAPLYAVPIGRCLYGYWADTTVLNALLGDNAQDDLRDASWSEWAVCIETLSAWLADPAAAQQEFTLGGHPHTLPAQKPVEAAHLEALFGDTEQSRNNTDPLFAPALLAAGDVRSDETLYGALNGLCSAILLESAHHTQQADGAQALGDGQVLFTRALLSDLTSVVPTEMQARLTVVPLKADLIEEDLFTQEYNLTGLTHYPVLSNAGWLAIPQNLGESSHKAAAAALLWLYGSAEGEQALTEQAFLITPWDTASDASALGAWQVNLVESGILPAPALTQMQSRDAAAAVRALQEAARADKSQEALKAARDQFLIQAIEALHEERVDTQ